MQCVKHISIHALREEGDASATSAATTPMIFLSTPSARRATKGRNVRVPQPGISIHALREEGDQFEIRGIPVNKKFLSTPSARRATFLRTAS